ncbi:MAG TPA: hypothetical protein VIE64_08255 [Solirubrobacterales bacterium]|jgi:hypothetical protein
MVINLSSERIEVDPLTDETANFIALANVLDGIREHGLRVHNANHDSTLVTHLNQKVGNVQTRPLEADAQRLLRVAWQTELAARLSESFDDPDLRRIGALSLPMQAYYALFNARRALSIAAGAPIYSHTSMHKDFANNRVGVLPPPWGIVLNGDPRSTLDCAMAPNPRGFTPYKFNPMERSHAPEAHLFYALLIARRWKFEEARKKWLENNRKHDGSRYVRLPSGKPDELVDGLRPTTVLDFLYELRRRANYEKADEFLSSADDAVVKRYYDGILYLVTSGLLLTEAQIALFAGTDALEEAATTWISRAQRIGSSATRPLKDRLAVIKSVA